MRKLYKRDQGRLLYRECWVEAGATTVHHGVVGRRGAVERGELAVSEAAFERAFVRESRDLGYAPIPTSEMFSLVVQFPMKSAMGNKRDRWLLETVSKHLDEELGWRGLGHVDGNDFGSGELNVFSWVVDDVLGADAAKARLRASRLDLARARIATRRRGEDQYVLRYSKNALPAFSIA